MLKQDLSPPPPEVTWSSVSPDAYDELIGVYKNETTFEITLLDGKLMMQSGESTEEIMQGGENLYRAPIEYVPAFPERPFNFSVEATSDGRARLLRIGSRVWARKLP